MSKIKKRLENSKKTIENLIEITERIPQIQESVQSLSKGIDKALEKMVKETDSVKEIRQEILKKHEEIIKIRSSIVKDQKGHFKQLIAVALLSAIFGSVGAYIVIIVTSEDIVELNTAAKIENDTLFLTVNNDATHKSASKISVYGLIDNQEVRVAYKDDILIPAQEPTTIQIDLESVIEKIPLDIVGEEFKKITLPEGNLYEFNTLFYKIGCEECKNEDKWEKVTDHILILSFSCNLKESSCVADRPMLSWKR